MSNKNSAFNKFLNNKIAVAVTIIILLAALFVGVFFLTAFIYENRTERNLFLMKMLLPLLKNYRKL